MTGEAEGRLRVRLGNAGRDVPYSVVKLYASYPTIPRVSLRQFDSLLNTIRKFGMRIYLGFNGRI